MEIRYRICLVGLGLVVSSLLVADDQLTPESDRVVMEHVRVSDDGGRFISEKSGTTFRPWGFNYLGEFEKLAEEEWETDWERLETDFREMAALGANVVRWHLQFATYMRTPDEADAAQLARLRKLLDLARDNGLYLDLTGLSCYRLDRVPAWYDALSEADRWKAQARFWEVIAETCAGHPAVFCYDLMNEPIIGDSREGEPPWLTGELGGFYFVQRICNRPGEREQKDIAEAWVNQMVDAIRRHDEKTLVTVGVIPWAQVFPGAKPLFYSPQVARRLDFTSVHFYPAAGKVPETLEALAVYDNGKPLVVEETFPLNCSLDELDQFIDGAGRVEGWVSHYFGKTIAEHREGAKPSGPLVAEFLEYWRTKGQAFLGSRN